MGINNLFIKLNYIIEYYIAYHDYLIKKLKKNWENCYTRIFILSNIIGNIKNVNIKIIAVTVKTIV